MANLKEVRERISSVKSTQQITKAMKLVSAAKLRRAQTAITELRPYSQKLQEVLSNILSNLEGDAAVSLGVERPVERVLIVLITSNRGLCGAFNSNLNKRITELIETSYKAQYDAGAVTILCAGKKGLDYVKRRFPKATLITDHLDLMDKANFEHTAEVAQQAIKGFEAGKYDKVDIIYARFRNAAMQFFEAEPFLPVPKMESEDGEVTRADFLFEPNKEELLEFLIPTILRTQLHKTLLDSAASEHGARMTAMDNATENAEELLKDLRIRYNKARQEAITNEISEIVGGAAALESN